MNPIAFIVGGILALSLIRPATLKRSRYIFVAPQKESKCLTIQHCYTLTQIAENPTRYLASYTTLEFLPGTHTLNSSNSAIEGVSNIALVGSSDSVSKIECRGEFGFAFVNVTKLTISNLWISECSAPQMWTSILYYMFAANLHNKWDDSRDSIIYSKIPAALYLIQVSNVQLSAVNISNSRGAGLLGINLLGNTSITNSNFIENQLNCYFQFMDAIKFPLHIPQATLQLHNSEFSWATKGIRHSAAGLTIVMDQSLYSISVNIINVTTYGNKGDSWGYGNIVIRFDKCNNHLIEINIQGLNCSRPSNSSKDLDEEYYSQSGMSLGGQLSSEDYDCKNMYFQTPIRIENSLFSHNKLGLSLWKIREKLVILENVTISENKAAGSSLSISQSTILAKNTVFSNNNGKLNFVKSSITFQVHTFFFGNRGTWGALYISSSKVIFQGNTNFLNNKGVIGGAIYASNTTLTFKGNAYFLENEGYDGGAIAFHSESILVVQAHSKMNFTGNHAKHQGGAIYIYDFMDPSETVFGRTLHIQKFHMTTCFYQFGYKSHVIMDKNTAVDAGSALFGGWVDICDNQQLNKKPITFDDTFEFIGNLTNFSQISSIPVIVCVCKNSNPNCKTANIYISIYPGQTFKIPVVAVGQRFGTVPAVIRSTFSPTQSIIQPTLEVLEYSQNVSKVCTNLSYTVKSSYKQETIILSIEEYGNIHDQLPQFLVPDIYIYLQLKKCPRGFMFDNISCVCDPVLQKHMISCDINTQNIYRQPPFWIHTPSTEGAQPGGVVVHKHCPFDYCKPYSLNLRLDNPDEQCAFHRSGILCGACQHNLSHVLGSSNCKQCSSLWPILLIPTTAIAGIVLVVFLMFLNLTVSVGTINGLIFYANIVRANHTVFFPYNANNTFCSWFIAWLNLDLGFEACFYNGMDAYIKIWLQFLFPVYIWFVVILVIVSSHYSISAAKLAGRNAVQVLATLFLLSYTKLLRTTITVLSFTTLEYPDGSVRRVWLYDGNVDYLKGKHIPLFMGALLVLLVLSLPYTALLLFIQCLQLKSKYRALFWIGKFKPLFDAYTGPYKDKHRYWTGFLLLARAVLFLIFSANAFGDPAVNLLAIVATMFFLFIKVAVSSGMYKIWYLNMLEHTFIFNLGILSATSLYARAINGNQVALTYTSVSIAFATFCGIIIHHIAIKITSSQQPFQCIKWSINECRRRLRARNARQDQEEQPGDMMHPSIPQQVPVIYIQLREPLMEYCDGSN